MKGGMTDIVSPRKALDTSVEIIIVDTLRKLTTILFFDVFTRDPGSNKKCQYPKFVVRKVKKWKR